MSHSEAVDDERAWLSKLNEIGLATPHWPRDYGGAGLGIEHLVILAEESARADAPTVENFLVSFNHIPATLMMWGTEEQKRRYLPGVPKGDLWCQGFSEPNAGSDLASLKCKAVRDGDDYVINGQKIWSSYAMEARYCILLARTDPEAPKHAGITFFLMDMKAPGVEVRPIRQANGEAEFGELFLTDVRIPVHDRVGEEGQGWAVAQSTLAAERGVIAFELAERQRYRYERVLANAVTANEAWLDDDQLRREFTSLMASLQAVRGLIRKLLGLHDQPEAIGVLPAIVKLLATQQRQRFGDFLVRARQLDGQIQPSALDRDDAMFDYIYSFALTISGGSNEIMRNIIAERGFGLPR